MAIREAISALKLDDGETAVELARQTDLSIESDGEVISRSPLGL